MSIDLNTGLLLALACGVGLGMGLMAIIHEVIKWDTSRRLAGQISAANRRHQSAADQARAQLEHRPAPARRPAPPRYNPGPAAGAGRRARPPMPASATGELPTWDGNGQQTGWTGEVPGPVLAEQLPSYQRPYAPTGQY